MVTEYAFGESAAMMRESLETLVKLLEQVAPGMRGSILLKVELAG